MFQRSENPPPAILPLIFVFLLSFCNQEANFVSGFFMEGVRFGVRTMTSDSFESDIIDSKEPWILAIKGSKVSEKEWQNEENMLRGVVNVAFIDLATDGKILFQKGILKKDKPSPLAVVFPYGGIKTKKTKSKGVESVREAKRIALLSLSENYVTWIKNKLQVETFVRKAYQSWPRRFPAVLTTEKRVIPPLYRAISIKYSKFFNFGIVHSSMAKVVIGLADGAKVPRLDILIATINENTTMTFNGLTYDEAAYGPVKYQYLIRFLYSAHNKHWPELPGSKKYAEDVGLEEFYKEDLERIFANPEKTESKPEKSTREGIKLANITEITYENYKTICDDSTKGFCVVSFFDGLKKSFEKTYAILSQVHKIEYFQDKPLKFVWINVTCHPEFGITFGVTTDTVPALLIAKPQLRVFAMHSGKFSKNAIGEFMDKLLTGRVSFSRYSRFPDDLENSNCGSSELKDNKVDPDVEKQTVGEAEGTEENQNREEL